MIERKDKLKNKAKVVKSVIKDPTKTQREIAKETWLWLGTVNRQTKDLEQNGTESNIMDRILWNDDKIMDLVNQIHLREIQKKYDNDEELTLQDHKLLWDMANNSTKRKAIFWKNDDWDKAIQFIIS